MSMFDVQMQRCRPNAGFGRNMLALLQDSGYMFTLSLGGYSYSFMQMGDAFHADNMDVDSCMGYEVIVISPGRLKVVMRSESWRSDIDIANTVLTYLTMHTPVSKLIDVRVKPTIAPMPAYVIHNMNKPNAQFDNATFSVLMVDNSYQPFVKVHSDDSIHYEFHCTIKTVPYAISKEWLSLAATMPALPGDQQAVRPAVDIGRRAYDALRNLSGFGGGRI